MRQLLKPRPHRSGGLHPERGRQERDAEISQTLVACRREGKRPADLFPRFGANQHIEEQFQVQCAARQRALHPHQARRIGQIGLRKTPAFGDRRL